MSGERALGLLLAGLAPRLEAGDWVFVSVPSVPPGLAPLMTFREDEGLTCVLPADAAVAAGLSGARFRRITLGVQSSLEAVGLTAAVAATLAGAGIAANVVAAFHHDHVFVPAARADEALARLEALHRHGA